MHKYPAKAAVFLVIQTLCAMIAAFFFFTHRDVSAQLNTGTLIVWALLGIQNESLAIHDQRGNIYISTIEAVFFAAYLSGGVLAAFVCITATVLFSFRVQDGTIRHALSKPFRLTLFNHTHFIVALLVVDTIFKWLVRITGGLLVLPAFLTAPVFFMVSCFLNALFYYFEEDRDFMNYLIRVFRPFYMDALIASSGAIIISLTYPRYGILSSLFFITPIIMARLTFLERVS